MYEKVPNIISNKDLSYLSDMFSWNYISYKESINMTKMIEKEEIKTCVRKASNIFLNNMKNILKILAPGTENE